MFMRRNHESAEADTEDDSPEPTSELTPELSPEPAPEDMRVAADTTDLAAQQIRLLIASGAFHDEAEDDGTSESGTPIIH